MKTFQRVLCVMLSILMAMSCLSAVAFAADGESFTSLDYQNNNKADAVSFQFDDVSARYIEIRVYTIAQNITTAMNLNEFMLFKQE